MARLRDSGRLSLSTAALSGNPTRLLQPETVSLGFLPRVVFRMHVFKAPGPIGRDLHHRLFVRVGEVGHAWRKCEETTGRHVLSLAPICVWPHSEFEVAR